MKFSYIYLKATAACYFCSVSAIWSLFLVNMLYAQNEATKEVPIQLLGENSLNKMLESVDLITKSSSPLLPLAELDISAVTIDHQAQKLYWSEAASRTVYEANLDGTEVSEFAVLSGSMQPVRGIAVSNVDNVIVYSNGAELYKSDLDGANPIGLISNSSIESFEYNPGDGKVYYMRGLGIERVGIDGQNLEVVYDGEALSQRVESFTIDGDNSRILINYYDFSTPFFEDRLVFCELDGTLCAPLPDFTSGTFDVMRLDPVGSRIIGYSVGFIQLLNLTGARLPGFSTLPRTGFGYRGNKFAFDPNTEKVYLASDDKDALYATQLDGSQARTIKNTVVGGASNLVLNEATSRVFFYDHTTESVKSIGILGGDLMTHLAYEPSIASRLVQGVDSFTVDEAGEKLIFAAGPYDSSDRSGSVGILNLLNGDLDLFLLPDFFDIRSKILLDQDRIIFIDRDERSIWVGELSTTGRVVVNEIYSTPGDIEIDDIFLAEGVLYWVEEMRNNGESFLFRSALPDTGMVVEQVESAFGAFQFNRGLVKIQDIRNSTLYFWDLQFDELRARKQAPSEVSEEVVYTTQNPGFINNSVLRFAEVPVSGDDDEDKPDSHDDSNSVLIVCPGNPNAATLDYDQNGILDCEQVTQLQQELNELEQIVRRLKPTRRRGQQISKKKRKIQKRLRRKGKRLLASVAELVQSSDVEPTLSIWIVSIPTTFSRLEKAINTAFSGKTGKKARRLKEAKQEAFNEIGIISSTLTG